MVPGLFANIAIFPLIISAILSFIAVPAVIKIAIYFGLVDDPRIRPHPAHVETRVIPRAGGLAIFFGIILGVLIFIPFSKEFMGILLGVFMLVVVGIIDDKKDVHPYIRLGVNLVAASLIVFGGASLRYITNPINGTILHLDTFRLTINLLGFPVILLLSDVLTIVWLVWAMNMVGWSTGVDGQMPGFVAITAIVIGILSFRQLTMNNFPAWTGTALAFITAGAYLGFLPWNFYPQKIMPGYGGKAMAGYLLGTLAILNSAKFGTALLVLGLPAIDAIYVLTSRIFSGKNPTQPGRNHLHHRLLDAGWGRRKVALFYWAVSAILGLVALNVTSQQKFFTALVVAVVVAAIILWLKLSTTFLGKRDPDSGLKI